MRCGENSENLPTSTVCTFGVWLARSRCLNLWPARGVGVSTSDHRRAATWTCIERTMLRGRTRRAGKRLDPFGSERVTPGSCVLWRRPRIHHDQVPSVRQAVAIFGIGFLFTRAKQTTPVLSLISSYSPPHQCKTPESVPLQFRIHLFRRLVHVLHAFVQQRFVGPAFQTMEQWCHNGCLPYRSVASH
jgi:hypothetical protein